MAPCNGCSLSYYDWCNCKVYEKWIKWWSSYWISRITTVNILDGLNLLLFMLLYFKLLILLVLPCLYYDDVVVSI